MLDLPYIVDKLANQDAPDPLQSERARRLDGFLKSAVAHDIGKYRPAFILVDMSSHKQGIRSGAFDLLAYLSESPGIAAQLKDYSAYLSPDSPQGLVGQPGRTFAVLRRTKD